MMGLKSDLVRALAFSLALHGLLLLGSPLTPGRIGGAPASLAPGSTLIAARLAPQAVAPLPSAQTLPQLSRRRAGVAPNRVSAKAAAQVATSLQEGEGELSMATWSVVEFRLHLAELLAQQHLPATSSGEWWVRVSMNDSRLGVLRFSDANLAHHWQSTLLAAMHQLGQKSDWPRSPLVIELHFLSSTELNGLP